MMNDPFTPFYVDPFDSPSMVLVSPPLTGDNYNKWRQTVCLVLGARNKLGFLDGSIVPPMGTNFDETLHHAWMRNDQLVACWLRNSISQEVALTANMDYSSSGAAQIWKDLEERFQRFNVPRFFELKKELANCTQECLSVTGYFTRFKTLFEQFGEDLPIHTCSCGGAKPLIDHFHKESLMAFLMGLNDSFSQIRSIILLKDPLPSIDDAFSLLVQQENNVRATKSLQWRKDSQRKKDPRRKKPIVQSMPLSLPLPLFDIVESPPESHAPPQMNIVESQTASPIIVSIISFMKPNFTLQVDGNDTILKVKEKIFYNGKAMEVERIVLLHARGRELRDHQLVKDCHINDVADDRSRIYMYERTANVGVEEKILTVILLPKIQTDAIAVEINAAAKVSDLKKELQKSDLYNNSIPAHGHYCLIYNQCLMNESMPFEWHGIQHGHIIEISGY